MVNYNGTAGNDDIQVYGGNTGDDSVAAGAGDDYVYVDAGSDSGVIDGGAGNDDTYVAAFADIIETCDPDTGTYTTQFIGADTSITGGAGDDTITTQVYDGDLVINAGTGSNTIIVGGHGNVTIPT